MDSEHTVDQSSRKQWVAALGVTSIMCHIGILEHLRIRQDVERATVASEFGQHVGLVTIGAFFGAISADTFGRRMTLLITTIFVVPRAISIFFEDEEWSWTVRIFVLFGLGIRLTLVPLYISEIGNIKNKGRLMTLQIPIQYLGSMISLIITTIFSNGWSPTVSQILNGILLALSASFHFVVVALYPETPSYLIAKKRYKEAAYSLALFEGRSHEQMEREILELSDMNIQTNEDQQGYLKKKCGIFQYKNKKTLVTIISLIVINSASALSLSHTKTSNLSSSVLEDNIRYTFISAHGLVLAMSIFATSVIDFLKRKKTLSLVIFASFIVAIIGIASPVHYQWMVLGAFIIQLFGHIIIDSVILAYIGDFSPTNSRALAIAFVVSCTFLIKDIVSLMV